MSNRIDLKAIDPTVRGALASLAQMLVDTNWLTTAEDVVYFIEKPWKYDELYTMWIDAGQPTPPDTTPETTNEQRRAWDVFYDAAQALDEPTDP